MTRIGQSIFDKHPDGARILQEIITHKISKIKAAAILGCAPSNITQYMQRHNLQVQGKKNKSPKVQKPTLNLTKSPIPKKVKQKPAPKKPPTPSDNDLPLNEMAQKTLESADTPLKYLSPTDIKELQQMLMDQIRNGDIKIDFDQFMELSKEVYRHYALQLKHNLNDKTDEQIIKLNEEDVQQILNQIEEEHCNTCPYRQYFTEQKTQETTAARLAPE